MNMRVNDVTFDAATEAVIEKVRKLLALAKNNDNEHQAEAAANKARELLEAYNLDLAHINKDKHAFTPRDKQTLNGGLYSWQRDLWHMTAQLNFCKYWFIRGTRAGTKYEHELLGSKVNVISTTIMAQYLQDAVERLARDWVKENRPGSSIFIKEAIAYREGMTNRLVARMWQIRADRVKAEEAKVKAERENNAAHGIFTENALVISDVINTEDDLNNDHVMGWPMGTSAQNRRDLEVRMEAARKAADEALRVQNEWDEAHPEEAAARKAKEKAEEDARWEKYKAKHSKARDRKMTPEEERRQLGSYHQGYDDGEHVSLDKQIDKGKLRLK